MRSISSNGLTKLATNLGTEPINIIEIRWTAGGNINAYSDRDIPPNIQGRILELGNLDNTVKVSEGGENQSISVKLSDTDGSIKAILDQNDIHKRPCWVYQWFQGLDLSDKFLLFKGQINSPITWNEGERTVSFDIVSKIEDAEIGFSIDEGNFPLPPYELIGKPWPLCFGTVVNVPAVGLRSLATGILGTGVAISDFTLPLRIELAGQLQCDATEYLGQQGALIGGNIIIDDVWGADPNCVAGHCALVADLKSQLRQQQRFEIGQITVFGGKYFPQGQRITLDINGGLFTGTFNGDVFSISSRRHPSFFGLSGDPNYGGPAYSIADGLDNYLKYVGISQFLSRDGIIRLMGIKQSQQIQTGCPGSQNQAILHGSLLDMAQQIYDNAPTADFFFATPGSSVTLAGSEELVYVANLLPSTVLAVRAFREFDTGSVLVTVPEQFYQVRHTDYGGYVCTEIVFKTPLSRRGVGWSDDIFVTLTSSVGPNTVDIIRWLIGKYTPYSIDNASFDHVRAAIDNYPSHFPILERKNILTALEEIAYQSRCALFLRNDVFYLKYLSEEPTPVATITEDDVEAKTLELFHSPTEDLITKLVAKWRYDYAKDDASTFIYRFNVATYGKHEQEYDFYIYNIAQLVQKSATFWLIRKANTWRKIKLKTSLRLLNVETFDCVSVNLPDFAQGGIRCIVERADYDSDSNRIEMELWTPVLSGTQVPYDFAYPANIEQFTLFPKITEIQAGKAGGGNTPGFQTSAPPGHITSVNQILSISNLDWPDHFDHGDPLPSDKGDKKPSPDATRDPGGAFGGQDPNSMALAGLLQRLNALQTEVQQAKEAALKAQQAAIAAQQAAKEAQKAGGGSGSGDGGTSFDPDSPEGQAQAEADAQKCNDGLKSLPTPEELAAKDKANQVDGEPPPCRSTVTLGWFPLKTIVIGGKEICVPAGPSRIETFVFDNDAAADKFADAARAKYDAAHLTGHEGTCNPPFSISKTREQPGCKHDPSAGDKILAHSIGIAGNPSAPPPPRSMMCGGGGGQPFINHEQW